MGRLAKDVSPVVRLELVDRVVLGGDMGVKAARALAECLKLKSLEELLGVVCIHTTLTPAIFDSCADAYAEVLYLKEHP